MRPRLSKLFGLMVQKHWSKHFYRKRWGTASTISKDIPKEKVFADF